MQERTHRTGPGKRRMVISLAAAGFAGLLLATSMMGPVPQAQGAAGSKPAPSQPQQPQPLSLADRANQVLGLTASEIVSLTVNPAPDVPLTAAITIDGHAYTLSLLPHSVRAPEYQLRAQLANGSIVPVDAGPDRMLRGSLVELPGSMAAGGLLDDGLHVVMRMPDGAQIWAEPLAGRVAGAAPDQYVLYRSENVIHPNGGCGVDAAFLRAHPPIEVIGGGGAGPDGATVYCTELACDADFEYYLSQGSNITNVQNRINLVINTVNLQYLNEVDIQHVITNIIVRTAEPDPYSSTNPSTLLVQLQNQWNANHGNIPRDVVHLFTAKNLDGGVIGIAYLNVVCNLASAYGLVQSDCCGSLACATDLTAHEIGHNWSATHCSCSNPAYTMNPSLTCINRHAAVSISEITNYRNSITWCLSACADATLPFYDEFPATTFDSTKWTTVAGALSNTQGTNEPSPPNSMNLEGTSTGGAQIRSSRINTAGLFSLTLQFQYQRRGGGDQPEAGDDLIVEFFNNLGTWIEVNRQLGSGAAMTTYLPVSLTLPVSAMHSEFRMRFRAVSFQPGLDDWFVDNVNLTGVGIPSNDSCINAILVGAGSAAFSTLGASTDGPDETSACNFNGVTQISNDIWYKYFAQCTGTATVSLCGANYNAKLAVYTNACPAGPGSTIACNDDFCGNAPQVSFPVVANNIYRVRIGGVSGATGSGTMSISCIPTPPSCPADITLDGQVNINDLLSVINAWGPCPAPPATCPADITADGQVNINDLLAVINAWGPCP